MSRLSQSLLRPGVLPVAVIFTLLNGATFVWAGPAGPAQTGGGYADRLDDRGETGAAKAGQLPAAGELPQEVSEIGSARPSQTKRSRVWPPSDKATGVEGLPRRQRQELLKSNFAKMKRDAAELTALARSLEAELEESNENVFSMTILEKARKIEALAKRISKTAKIY